MLFLPGWCQVSPAGWARPCVVMWRKICYNGMYFKDVFCWAPRQRRFLPGRVSCLPAWGYLLHVGCVACLDGDAPQGVVRWPARARLILWNKRRAFICCRI